MTVIIWGDYNKDGFLDLIVVRHLHELEFEGELYVHFGDSPRPLSLFKNNGDGKFTDVTTLLGDPNANPSPLRRPGFQPVFVDYDNDGDADIHVCNDFGRELKGNVLWRNDGLVQGNWIFTDVSIPSGANSQLYCMGTAVGDFDNNGFFDFYMTNIRHSELLENVNSAFTDTTNEAQVGRGFLEPNSDSSVGWGTMFLDYDNDGDLDLYLVAGNLDSNPLFISDMPNALFRNDGNYPFTDVSSQSGADDLGYGRGGVYADFNNDGCLDMFVVNIGRLDGTQGISRLFQNNCDNNNWLIIKTIGTISNKDGIGTRIKVTTLNGDQIREVASGGSSMSQNMLPVHFGLGNSDKANIEILWPSGVVQSLTNIEKNQIIKVVEPINFPHEELVGGEFLPLETTALILTGSQSFSWIIPVVLSGIGIGLFVFSRKSE